MAATKNARDIFLNALDRAPADRATYLDEACGDDTAVRQRVEALLRANDDPGAFLSEAKSGVSNAALLPPGDAAVDSGAGEQDLDATGARARQPDEAPHPGTTDYRPPVEPGLVIAGRYTLVEKIGEGGMGEVWVAKQTEPIKRRVALKLIKAGMDTKAVLQRFEAERQALAMMDHPNIARVLDGGMTADRRPYFVMELVNGLPLTKFCDEAKLGIRERLELFAAICQAVQHAHQKGIIHRDLKPSNILVTLIDAWPVPKVIDFGVAKAIGGKLLDESLSTQFGAVVGTLEYMSPEQAGFSGSDIDTRADIYSLGVILYELLTGLRPINAKRLRKAAYTEMIRIIHEEEPSKPSTRLSTDESLPSLAALRQTEPKQLMALLRGELDWVVMKCLEKRRERRYETANALVRDIQRYLADEVVEARPPSTGYRLKKFVRRHKGQVIAASLVLFTLVVGIVGTTIGLIEAKRQERLAIAAHNKEAERADAEAKERRRAEEAERRANAAAADTAAVLKFFEDKVLAAPRPEGQEGGISRNVTLLAAINAAEPLIEESFQDKPAVELSIRKVLWQTYWRLAVPAQVVRQSERLVALLSRDRPPEDPELLMAKGSLAIAYHDTERNGEAVRIYEAILPRDEVVFGTDHQETIKIMSNLGQDYRATNRNKDAIRILEQAAERARKRYGNKSPEALDVIHDLANSYRADNRLSECISLLEQNAKAREELEGPDGHYVAYDLSHLGAFYIEASRLPEALSTLERAYAINLKRLGEKHPNTLENLYYIAVTFLLQKRFDEALPKFEKALRIAREQFGEAHRTTIEVLKGMVALRWQTGDHVKTLELRQQLLKIQLQKYVASHPDVLDTQTALILDLKEVGKLADAISEARNQLSVFRESMPAGSPGLGGALASNGSLLLKLKAWSEAESVLCESFGIRQKSQPDAWTTFNTQSMLGGALLGQNKYADAEPLLLAGYEGMKQRMKTIPEQGKVRIPEAIERLVQLYDALEKKVEAAKWRMELEGIKAAQKKTEKKP